MPFFAEVYKKILNSKKILLVTHEHPDGDALASVCAFLEWLKSLNKICFAYCRDNPAPQFSFLPWGQEIKKEKDWEFSSFDLIIILDCGSLSRTNLAEEIKGRNEKQTVIEFDHHPKIDSYADLELRYPAAATAEIIYDFFKKNKIRITKNIASCLLFGILTDTANFLYPSASAKTIAAASALLLSGARFPRLTGYVLRNKSLSALKVWGQALLNLYINEKYKIAVSLLKAEDIKEDIKKEKLSEAELEGIAGFLSNLDGVKVVLFLREQADGTIKGSLRASRPDIDVSYLARFLGGGGHRQASGFEVNGRLEETEKGWRIIDF